MIDLLNFNKIQYQFEILLNANRITQEEVDLFNSNILIINDFINFIGNKYETENINIIDAYFQIYYYTLIISNPEILDTISAEINEKKYLMIGTIIYDYAISEGYAISDAELLSTTIQSTLLILANI